MTNRSSCVIVGADKNKRITDPERSKAMAIKLRNIINDLYLSYDHSAAYMLPADNAVQNHMECLTKAGSGGRLKSGSALHMPDITD